MDNTYSRLVGLTYQHQDRTVEIVQPLPGLVAGKVSVADPETGRKWVESLSWVVSSIEGLPQDVAEAGSLMASVDRVQTATARLAAAVAERETPGVTESLEAVRQALEAAALEAEAALAYIENASLPFRR